MDKIKIGDRRVGDDEPTFVVAEVSSNWDKNIKIAKKTIDGAKKAGVDAVKFQICHAEEFIASKDTIFKYTDGKGKRHSITMFEMFKEWELTNDIVGELAKHAKKIGMLFFATAQDKDAADILLEVDACAIKIGSDDTTNTPLIEYVAKKDKPLILSTGMSTLAEVETAVNAYHNAGGTQLILLQCTACYPTKPSDANLRMMETLKQSFQVPVGFSDHTTTISIPMAAAAMGAVLIEKHFTLDKNRPGTDHYFSGDVDDFRAMVNGIREIESAMGSPIKRPIEAELGYMKKARRTIVTNVKIKKGQKIKKNMLGLKRDGKGIHAKYLDIVDGRAAKKDIDVDEGITWDKV